MLPDWDGLALAAGQNPDATLVPRDRVVAVQAESGALQFLAGPMMLEDDLKMALLFTAARFYSGDGMATPPLIERVLLSRTRNWANRLFPMEVTDYDAAKGTYKPTRV